MNKRPRPNKRAVEPLKKKKKEKKLASSHKYIFQHLSDETALGQEKYNCQ
jgi:hypothetical protein